MIDIIETEQDAAQVLNDDPETPFDYSFVMASMPARIAKLASALEQRNFHEAGLIAVGIEEDMGKVIDWIDSEIASESDHA